MKLPVKSLIMATFVLAGVLLVASTAFAAPSSPFVGQWRAIDVFDDSTIRLSISGGGRGIVQLVWTEDFWSFCQGDPAIGRGTGSLNAGLLEADMVFRCLTKDDTRLLSMDFAYNSGNDTITNGTDTWTRVGRP